MKRPNAIRKFVRRSLLAVAVLSAGMTLGGGCSPEVRAVVLSGLNELVVAMIDAFFVTLDSDNGMPTASLDAFLATVTPWLS